MGLHIQITGVRLSDGTFHEIEHETLLRSWLFHWIFAGISPNSDDVWEMPEKLPFVRLEDSFYPCEWLLPVHHLRPTNSFWDQRATPDSAITIRENLQASDKNQIGVVANWWDTLQLVYERFKHDPSAVMEYHFS